MITQLDEHIDNYIEYIEKYFKVLTKPDEQGRSDLVPMKLYPAQRHYIQNRTHRNIALKPRQIRLSTAVMAVNAHALFTIPFTRQALITHHDDVSQFLFLTIQRFWNNLPEQMRPQKDWSSGTRMRFPLLDSFIHIDSAESKTIGFGESLTHAHLSEMCRWPEHKANEMYAGISQTVGANGWIDIESNPRGRGGLYYRLYHAAKKGETEYKHHFYPWWWEPEYRKTISYDFQPTPEESLLMNTHNLDPEQIQFRRDKLAEFRAIGNEDLFYQEYPENDIDCWLTSEIAVFDGLAIKRYLQQIAPGRQEGHLTIWKDVIGGEKYVIGVDVAGGKEKGDWSVASVLHVKRDEYVARLRCKMPPDFFADQVLKLGEHYNWAEIGVERTGHGHMVLRILLENSYPNLYYHTEYDQITKETLVIEPGWRTTVKSKPIMVDMMARALRSGDLISYSENLMAEAAGYVWDGNTATKSGGSDDDELDAVMISLQLRENAPIVEASKYKITSYARL